MVKRQISTSRSNFQIITSLELKREIKTERIFKMFCFGISLILSLFYLSTASAIVNDGFDFPIGIPDATGWYVFRDFLGTTSYDDCDNHLGEDWNISTGGDTDAGLPVYAIANGKVIDVYYPQNPAGPNGWGHLVMIKHDVSQRFPGSPYKYVVSLYAHLGSANLPNVNEYVRRGEQIGVIGRREENGGQDIHIW